MAQKHFLKKTDSSYELICDLKQQAQNLEATIENTTKKLLEDIKSELVMTTPFLGIVIESSHLSFGNGLLVDFITHILFQDKAIFFGLCDSTSYPFTIKTKSLFFSEIKNKTELQNILKKIDELKKEGSGYGIELINDDSYDELIFRLTIYAPKPLLNT